MVAITKAVVAVKPTNWRAIPAIGETRSDLELFDGLEIDEDDDENAIDFSDED